MLVVNNLVGNITNLTKRTFLLLLVMYSYSCSHKKFIKKSDDSVSEFQKKAVQCVLEEYYRNTTKRIQSTAKVIVQKKSFHFQTGLGNSSESFAFSGRKLQDTILIEAPVKIKFVKNVKLSSTSFFQETHGLEEHFWRFSPLIFTQTEDFYLVYSEYNNYETTEVSIHLIRKKRNGSFEYLLPVNGYIVFY